MGLGDASAERAERGKPDPRSGMGGTNDSAEADTGGAHLSPVRCDLGGRASILP